ncbi:MAG: hypothetical protein UT63_C0003G0004 [Candidatus Gottesmanbacteria bacterium GW2011_GWC2_39_8]|uniref:Glycosyltransferase RgtA/B/C/D-like domain-containing protein n=1 Tax=Candidatus Gottesmanbacteria bacterium GW2011_GWC2_39_8 TaxID=1618450 RepID=A0A0G0Q2E4_9BACT|nr:MAG: hypothetical protein UT63_C0003G0004 [Candidatus Gottesmanbacteria bacterium GW2011_GWC2_39_8]
MNNIIPTIFILTTGVFIVKHLLRIKSSILVIFSLSYLLGSGLITLYMFFLSLFGFLTKPFVYSFSGLILISVFVKTKKNIYKRSFPKLNFSFPEIILLVLLSFTLIFIFINNTYWPPTTWDALTLYDFRAKVLTQTGNLYSLIDAGQTPFFISYYTSSPYLTSLLHSFYYFFGSTNPQIIYFLYTLFFIILFIHGLNKFTIRANALLLGILVLTLPFIFSQTLVSYTNLPYTVYLDLAFIYLLLYLKKGGRENFLISLILIFFSVWTRNREPFWVIYPVIIFFFSKRRRILLTVLSFVSIYFVSSFWQLPLNHLIQASVSSDKVFSGQPTIIDLIRFISISRLSEISYFLWISVFAEWKILLIIFSTVILFARLKLKEIFSDPLLWVIIFSVLLLFAGTYYLSLLRPFWKDIAGSAGRMMIFLPPLILFWIGTKLDKIFRTK